MRKLLRNDQWRRVENLLPGKVTYLDVRPRIIGALSRQCHGSPARWLRGGIYRRSLVLEIS